MNSQSRWLLFAIAVAFSTAIKATEITASFRGPGANETKHLIATVTAVPFGAVDRPEAERSKRSVLVRVPGDVNLDLPEGQWRLSIDVVGYFADPQLVVGGNGARVTFALWPTGWIEGKFALPEHGDAPRQVHVRFGPSEPRSPDAPPESFSVCTLKELDWRCEVAAGRIDLRLRANGFMTHFRSKLDIRPGKTLSLGSLRLEAGSSIVGFVSATQKIDLRSVRVTLTPATDEDPRRTAASAVTASVNTEKGGFEFRGVAPGMYKVHAAYKRLESDDVVVQVRENSESELRDPLLLTQPRQLRVAITPPLSPDGGPWCVTLTRQLSTSRWDTATESSADREGVFTWSGLRAGRYGVTVGSAPDRAFVFREFESVSEDMVVSISVPETKVEGSVKIGISPIAATVVIGGAHSSVVVSLTSDAEGQFAGTVPFVPEVAWDVTVQSSKPRIERNFKLAAKRTSEDEPVRLDITLPAGSITGVVVDPEGKAVTRATVSMKFPNADEGLLQTPTEADGSFLLEGLSAGTYELQAWTFDERDSDTVSVVLSDTGESQPTRLVVRKKNDVIGRVLTRSGTPVEGARVFLYPADVAPMMIVPRMTGPDGEFTVTVPRGSKEGDIAIIAAGFPFEMLHLRYDGRPSTFVLEPASGTITVDGPDFAEGMDVPQGFIAHRGALLPLLFFASNRDAQIAPGTRKDHVRVVIPTMEPGDYAFCRLTWTERRQLPAASLPLSGRCAFGTLGSFGTVTLATP